MSKKLLINNCQDCPHYREKASPPTGDSFDAADTDAYCNLHPKKWVIDGGNRWRKRKDTEIPKWCPL